MKCLTTIDTVKKIEEISDLFKYFSDPHRLRIMLHLLENECSVSQLAHDLSTSISAVSHQLRQLRLARLVSKRREGKVVFYQLHDEHIKQLILIANDHVQENDID